MTSKPNYMNAVNSLAGGKHKTCSTHGEYPTVWKEDATDLPTEEEIQTELALMISDWDAQEYARNRAAEYPSIAELTVALYDTDDKAAIETKRAAVKAKYPKPS